MRNSKTFTILALTASMTASVLTGCGSSSNSSASSSAASPASSSVSTASTETETDSASVETASGSSANQASASSTVLEDGVYNAEFTTDSSMFRVNETCDGKGRLTVENGKMTIHIVLTSENIVNLFEGTAEDAQKEGAQLIDPVEEEVTYDDGTTETVYAFDVPIPAIDEEFDLALIGTHGKWYDHKVKVSNPVKAE